MGNFISDMFNEFFGKECLECGVKDCRWRRNELCHDCWKKEQNKAYRREKALLRLRAKQGDEGSDDGPEDREEEPDES